MGALFRLVEHQNIFPQGGIFKFFADTTLKIISKRKVIMKKAISLLEKITEEKLDKIHEDTYRELKFDIVPKLEIPKHRLETLYKLIDLFRNDPRYNMLIQIRLISDRNVLMLGALRRFLLEIYSYVGPESKYPEDNAVDIRIALNDIAEELYQFIQKEIFTDGGFLERTFGSGSGIENWVRAEVFFYRLVKKLETKK